MPSDPQGKLETDLPGKIAVYICYLLYGETVEPEEALEIKEVARATQNLVSMAFTSVNDLFENHSFVCSECSRRVGGDPYKLGIDRLCPGCANWRVLMNEVMRRGLHDANEEFS